MELFFLEEENFAMTALLVLLALFIAANVRRTLREAKRDRLFGKTRGQPNRVAVFALKTLLFFVFYGFSVMLVVADNKLSLGGALDAMTLASCQERYITTGVACNKYVEAFKILGEGAALFNGKVLVWNVFVTLYIFACYFYFNVHMGFATLIVLFASHGLNTPDYHFFLAFGIVSAAVALAFLFYKLKRRLLDGIRYFFGRLERSPPVRVVEFYVVCLPYLTFSLMLSALNPGYLNVLIELAVSHALAYHTLYQLYLQGSDIGFDYDPW